MALLGAAGSTLLVAPEARAQEEEARLLFERGNEHLAQGLRARGRRRQRELSEALDAYLGVLRLGARTRNVIFNLALTLQELGRTDEAFNYYSEYLRSFELNEQDRAEGQRRLDALRPSVAVLSIDSEPPGAAVRIDRRDLPVRGTTPLLLAVAPGAHRIFLRREGFEPASAEATAAVGQTAEVRLELRAQPVAVQVIAPSQGRLTLDGEPIVAGRSVGVPPGQHVVRLELPGARPVERHFEVQPGAGPMVLELSASGPASAPVTVAVDTEAQLFLDDAPAGRGRQVQLQALPGPHVLRVEAPGHAAAVHHFTLDEPLSLRVALAPQPDTSGLHAGRAVSGIFASLAVVSSAVVGGLALSRHDQWQRDVVEDRASNTMTDTQLRAAADEVEGWLLATDVLLGVTAALGTTAIVLLAVQPPSSEESTVEVVARPAAGGGTVGARVRWGAR